MRSLKDKVQLWLNCYADDFLIRKENTDSDCFLFFKLERFADEPEVYLRALEDILEFGYEAIQWESHTPILTNFTQHRLSRSALDSLSREAQIEMLLELFMKTINSRKRQYRKCQFCGVKVAIEHRYDIDTCHGCASKELGVLY